MPAQLLERQRVVQMATDILLQLGNDVVGPAVPGRLPLKAHLLQQHREERLDVAGDRRRRPGPAGRLLVADLAHDEIARDVEVRAVELAPPGIGIDGIAGPDDLAGNADPQHVGVIPVAGNGLEPVLHAARDDAELVLMQRIAGVPDLQAALLVDLDGHFIIMVRFQLRKAGPFVHGRGGGLLRPEIYIELLQRFRRQRVADERQCLCDPVLHRWIIPCAARKTNPALPAVPPN